jgi:hypothetical protein
MQCAELGSGGHCGGVAGRRRVFVEASGTELAEASSTEDCRRTVLSERM